MSDLMERHCKQCERVRNAATRTGLDLATVDWYSVDITRGGKRWHLFRIQDEMNQTTHPLCRAGGYSRPSRTRPRVSSEEVVNGLIVFVILVLTSIAVGGGIVDRFVERGERQAFRGLALWHPMNFTVWDSDHRWDR